MFYLLKTIDFAGTFLNIAFLISAEDAISKSLEMELVVVLKNFSTILSVESSLFHNSSLIILNLL